MADYIRLTAGQPQCAAVDLPHKLVVNCSILLKTLLADLLSFVDLNHDCNRDLTAGDSSIVATVPLPARFAVVLDDYSRHIWKTPSQDITDAKTLYLVLELADYLEDSSYFSYAVKQLFSYWSNFPRFHFHDKTATAIATVKAASSAATATDNDWSICDEIKESLLVRYPFDFLPRSYLTNRDFMQRWMVESNNIIKLNTGLQHQPQIHHTRVLLARHETDEEGWQRIRSEYYIGKDLMVKSNYIFDSQGSSCLTPLLNLASQSRVNNWLLVSAGYWISIEIDFNTYTYVKSVYRYVDGKMEGDYRSYYKNGYPHSKGQYHDGNKMGDWYSYFLSVAGKLARVQHYNNSGLLHGESVSYFNVGDVNDNRVRIKENFFGGQLDGAKFTYSEAGARVAHNRYKLGVMEIEEVFDELGKRIFYRDHRKKRR